MCIGLSSRGFVAHRRSLVLANQRLTCFPILDTKWSANCGLDRILFCANPYIYKYKTFMGALSETAAPNIWLETATGIRLLIQQREKATLLLPDAVNTVYDFRGNLPVLPPENATAFTGNLPVRCMIQETRFCKFGGALANWLALAADARVLNLLISFDNFCEAVFKIISGEYKNEIMPWIAK